MTDTWSVFEGLYAQRVVTEEPPSTNLPTLISREMQSSLRSIHSAQAHEQNKKRNAVIANSVGTIRQQLGASDARAVVHQTGTSASRTTRSIICTVSPIFAKNPQQYLTEKGFGMRRLQMLLGMLDKLMAENGGAAFSAMKIIYSIYTTAALKFILPADELIEHEAKILEAFELTHRSQYVLITAPRQLGKTMTTATWAAAALLSIPGFSVGICAPSHAQAEQLLSTIRAKIVAIGAHYGLTSSDLLAATSADTLQVRNASTTSNPCFVMPTTNEVGYVILERRLLAIAVASLSHRTFARVFCSGVLSSRLISAKRMYSMRRGWRSTAVHMTAGVLSAIWWLCVVKGGVSRWYMGRFLNLTPSIMWELCVVYTHQHTRYKKRKIKTDQSNINIDFEAVFGSYPSNQFTCVIGSAHTNPTGGHITLHVFATVTTPPCVEQITLSVPMNNCNTVLFWIHALRKHPNVGTTLSKPAVPVEYSIHRESAP